MRRLAALAISLLVASPLTAGLSVWIGAVDGNWSNGANWAGIPPAAGADLEFLSSAQANALNNDFPAGTAFQSLSFNAAATFSPGGNTINLGSGGITATSVAVVNDFIPFTLTASQTWSSDWPGSIVLNGPATLDLNGQALQLTGSGDYLLGSLNINGGAGSITIGGTVNATLSGNLNYTGATSVGSGATLTLTSIGTVNTPIFVGSGGTFSIIPGFGPLTNSTVSLAAGSIYAATINGSGINQHSHFTSNAGVNVAGAGLSVTATTIVPAGTPIVIATGQGGTFLIGKFGGLPNGATVNAGVQNYTISYTSQDVILTAQTVAGPPSIAKSFGASSIPLATQTSLSFTIQNPNGTALTGVGFTDPLPAGLVVATPNNLTGSCGGGTITATAGSGSVSLSGATLAASATCTFSVNILATSTGPKSNSTTAVTSNEGGSGNVANASITVTPPAAPVISKAFGARTVAPGGTTSLSFTIQNNAAAAQTGIGFTDSLPAGLAVATPNALTGSCGGGTITATAASSSVSLTGASLAGGSSCTFSVNVLASTSGVKNNSTSAVTSTEGGTGNVANASTTVLSPPSIAKAFGKSSVTATLPTTLTFTIQNPASNPVSLTGVGFTDPMPAGLVVATPNGASTTCSGGTLTAVAGSGTITLSGATIASNTSCTATVSVVSNTANVYNNSTTAVTSSNGGTGNIANATLTVTPVPAPALGVLGLLALAAALALIAAMKLQ
jgi:uncharacterized repeat protein (TIGR01451 family)